MKRSFAYVSILSENKIIANYDKHGGPNAVNSIIYFNSYLWLQVSFRRFITVLVTFGGELMTVRRVHTNIVQYEFVFVK